MLAIFRGPEPAAPLAAVVERELVMLARVNARLGLLAMFAVLGLLGGGALAQGALSHAGAARAGARPRHASLSRARLLAAYGRLALSYDANRGQFARRVAFEASAGSSTLALTADGALLAVARASRSGRSAGVLGGRPGLTRAPRAAGPHVSYSVLGLALVGARRGLWPVGVSRLPGHVSYLIGKDRSRWHTNVPTYSRAVYEQAWPGVDVSFTGVQSRIEYAFTLAPDADPGRVAIRVSGARSLRVQPNGDLLARLAGGVIVRELAPHAYQTASDGRRVAVESRYRLAVHDVVHVAVGTYDHARQLTIDPALEYSTYLGGSGDDEAYGIAVDSAGDAYVTGYTASTDFPTTPGALQTALAGGRNVFVSKLNPAGTAVEYSTYLGGNFEDEASGIAVDAAGDAYVTGYTDSGNFPITPGAFQTSSEAEYGTAFVSELNPAGTALEYSTYLGGSYEDGASGIAIDSAGDAYVTGATHSTDFPTTPGAYQTANAAASGDSNAFVSELNPAGTALEYSTYLGGSYDDAASGIAIDSAGDAYVTGAAYSTDFPTTPGAYQAANASGANGSNAFVSELNPAGTALDYSTYLGGSTSDQANGIAIDASGDAYVTGYTSSTDFPITPGAYQTANAGSQNAFVSELNPAGTALDYSTYLGGSTSDQANGIAIDSAGDAYVTGLTTSTDFPTTPGAYQTTYGGGTDDAFVSKLYLGGTPAQDMLTVSKAGTGSATVTSSPAGIDCGATCSASFDAGAMVTLTAASDAGSSFAGFSGGGCSGTASTCTVTLSADTTVTATSTIASSGGGGGGGGTGGSGAGGGGVPVNTALPVISGIAKARGRLACSTGTWTNSPTQFAYEWSRDQTPIQNATASTYTVQTSDEGLTLTCTVTASNASGAGKPATSNSIAVLVPHIPRCPGATGSLHRKTLGLVRLGMTRAQARHAYRHSSKRGKKYEEFFCLTPIGVRVGYGSPALTKTLRRHEREQLANRVVWASTSSAYYSVAGIRVGARVAAAAKALRLTGPITIGLNDWYFAPNGSSTAILKVRHGIIEEIGICDKTLTTSHKTKRHFLKSFT